MGILVSLEEIKFSVNYRKDWFHHLFCPTKLIYSTFSYKENSLECYFYYVFYSDYYWCLQKYFWCCYSSIGNKNVNSIFDIQQIHRTRQKTKKSKYQGLCKQLYLYSMHYANESWQRWKTPGFPIYYTQYYATGIQGYFCIMYISRKRQ